MEIIFKSHTYFSRSLCFCLDVRIAAVLGAKVGGQDMRRYKYSLQRHKMKFRESYTLSLALIESVGFSFPVSLHTPHFHL